MVEKLHILILNVHLLPLLHTKNSVRNTILYLTKNGTHSYRSYDHTKYKQILNVSIRYNSNVSF